MATCRPRPESFAESAKLPWQWTDEERIAARVDPALAHDRVRAAQSREVLEALVRGCR
jgi:hypothetical protein